MKGRPKTGIYSDEHLYEIFCDLQRAMDRFYPDDIVAGNISGTLSEMRAKANHIVNLSKSIESATKAILPTRK